MLVNEELALKMRHSYREKLIKAKKCRDKLLSDNLHLLKTWRVNSVRVKCLNPARGTSRWTQARASTRRNARQVHAIVTMNQPCSFERVT